MTPIEEQLVDTSRKIADIVAANIGDDKELFDEAVTLMLRDEYPKSMRVSRVVYLVVEKHPSFVKPYISKFIKTLTAAKVDGVKRAILGIFIMNKIKISEEDFGELADICFTFLQDSNQAIAIRASAIEILINVVTIYPEIKPELLAVLESIIPEASSGLKGKSIKTIKILRNEFL